MSAPKPRPRSVLAAAPGSSPCQVRPLLAPRTDRRRPWWRCRPVSLHFCSLVAHERAVVLQRRNFSKGGCRRYVGSCFSLLVVVDEYFFFFSTARIARSSWGEFRRFPRENRVKPYRFASAGVAQASLTTGSGTHAGVGQARLRYRSGIARMAIFDASYWL